MSGQIRAVRRCSLGIPALSSLLMLSKWLQYAQPPHSG
jgi:hypothetical protein